MSGRADGHNGPKPASSGQQLPSEEACATFNPSQLNALGETHAGTLAILQGLVRNMVDGGVTQFADARIAWQEGKSDAAARAIHSMRGAYGTLGAEAFAAIAIELEAAITAGRQESIAALFDASEQSLSAAAERAGLWLANTAASSAAKANNTDTLGD